MNTTVPCSEPLEKVMLAWARSAGGAEATVAKPGSGLLHFHITLLTSVLHGRHWCRKPANGCCCCLHSYKTVTVIKWTPLSVICVLHWDRDTLNCRWTLTNVVSSSSLVVCQTTRCKPPPTVLDWVHTQACSGTEQHYSCRNWPTEGGEHETAAPDMKTASEAHVRSVFVGSTHYMRWVTHKIKKREELG